MNIEAIYVNERPILCYEHRHSHLEFIGDLFQQEGQGCHARLWTRADVDRAWNGYDSDVVLRSLDWHASFVEVSLIADCAQVMTRITVSVRLCVLSHPAQLFP